MDRSPGSNGQISVEIYRWDALQSDGKSDGKNVASSSREKFTVRAIPTLTVNSGRKTQHPCGLSGDRRLRRGDGKCLRSQAIHRTGDQRFEIGCAGQWGAGDGTACRSLIYGSTPSTADSPSFDPPVALAAVQSRLAPSPRQLGIMRDQK